MTATISNVADEGNPVPSKTGEATSDAARRQKNMAEMILVVIGDGPYPRDSLPDVVLDEIFARGKEYDDYALFNPVFDSMISQGLIVEMPDGCYGLADEASQIAFNVKPA